MVEGVEVFAFSGLVLVANSGVLLRLRFGDDFGVVADCKGGAMGLAFASLVVCGVFHVCALNSMLKPRTAEACCMDKASSSRKHVFEYQIHDKKPLIP